MRFAETFCAVATTLIPPVDARNGQEPLYQPQFSNIDSGSMAGSHQLIAQHRAIFNPTLYARVRDVWFGDLPWGAKTAKKTSQERWFISSPEARAKFDKTCHTEFSDAIASISPSRYPLKNLSDADITAPFVSEIYQNTAGDDELGSVKTAVSLMILLDQIPRNLYRTNETLRVVYEHYDRIAVLLARHITSTSPRVDLHPSLRLSMPHRQWFYLPLMHSENLADHRLFSTILGELKAEAKDDPDVGVAVTETMDFEDQHVGILERFGRYPHRNECLGRDYTDEERNWLSEGGQRFGVAG